VQVRCFANPNPNGSQDAALAAIASNTQATAFQTFEYIGRYNGNTYSGARDLSKNSNPALMGMGTRGRFLKGDGVTYLADDGFTNTSLPTNYFEYNIADASACCSGNIQLANIRPVMFGYGYPTFSYTSVPVAWSAGQACDSTTEDNMYNALPCFDSENFNTEWPDAIPDNWPGQEFAPDACEGVSFAIIHEGVTLVPPYTGQTGVRGDQVQLRVTLRTTGVDESIDLDVYPHFSAVPSALLRGFPLPTTVPQSVKQWDITGVMTDGTTPEYDFGDFRMRCGSEFGALYSDPTTGGFDSVTPLPPVDYSDTSSSGCFTLDGLSLTNPATWVRALGVMGVCLMRWAWVPTDVAGWADTTWNSLSDEIPFSFLTFGVSWLDTATAPGGSVSACFGSIELPSAGSSDTVCVDVSAVEDLLNANPTVDALLWFTVVGISVLLFAMLTVRMLF
jgi:hypothetical protein